MDDDDLLDALDAASAWLDLPGVHLVGQGEVDGKPCISVHASPPLERFDGVIPRHFRGYPVQLVESDEVVAGATPGASRDAG